MEKIFYIFLILFVIILFLRAEILENVSKRGKVFFNLLVGLLIIINCIISFKVGENILLEINLSRFILALILIQEFILASSIIKNKYKFSIATFNFSLCLMMAISIVKISYDYGVSYNQVKNIKNTLSTENWERYKTKLKGIEDKEKYSNEIIKIIDNFNKENLDKINKNLENNL